VEIGKRTKPLRPGRFLPVAKLAGFFPGQSKELPAFRPGEKRRIPSDQRLRIVPFHLGLPGRLNFSFQSNCFGVDVRFGEFRRRPFFACMNGACSHGSVEQYRFQTQPVKKTNILIIGGVLDDPFSKL
jgi:hypothetical protein